MLVFVTTNTALSAKSSNVMLKVNSAMKLVLNLTKEKTYQLDCLYN